MPSGREDDIVLVAGEGRAVVTTAGWAAKRSGVPPALERAGARARLNALLDALAAEMATPDPVPPLRTDPGAGPHRLSLVRG
jgi:hypothetical protein